MTPERARMLQAMSDAHDKMEADFLPHATFDRDRSHTGSDYNQHYLDYGPPPGAEEAFQAAMAGVLAGDPTEAILADLRKLANNG